MIHIGILKEGKVPVDRRVPLTPEQCGKLNGMIENIDIYVQKSDIRCFRDNEYREHGIKVVDSVDHCDILLGVKEVPVAQLIPEKTYLFFSHTIKEQEYNRELLQEIIKKKIRLIDYELLTDLSGKRLVAFGRYAGIVGAFNGIRTWGERYNLFHLRKASECFDLHDLTTEFPKVHLPKIKIAITGGGRVAKGAIEVMNGMGIRHVSPFDFIHKYFDEAVYTQLNSRDYHLHREGKDFHIDEFFENPERFEGDFLKYAEVADLLFAAAFWYPSAPVLFNQRDAMSDHFSIRVIADITCDIEGSIPSTKAPATIDDPVYDYNPTEDRMEPPFSDEGNISVMAVDNLPCELPRDASHDFGKELMARVIPDLVGEDKEQIIERATIAEAGELTKGFKYLSDFVAGK
jgi:alanine dehydrogenase